ncbi:hypothetical protein [Nocardioides sp. WS12]|uniref:hypothetical protein n=1 Tax=Nocardioides sp. WS12 TaxID=2486272 RepID=UPI0015F923E1|nr:hypothetical protein [Nocardioides sp. WS12]
MQDMIDRLARELAQAPEPGFDIASTVASGRKAVRRRRIAAGGAVLAAALVVGGTAWLVVPGDDNGPESSEVAVQPKVTPTPTETVTIDPGPNDTEPLLSGPDNQTIINPDATILERADYTSDTGTVVDTYHLRLRGDEYYAYIGDDEASSFPTPAQGLTLREWVAQTVDGSNIGDDAWVRFDNESHLVTVLDGLTIVRQEADPDLGANFAPPGDPTALAEVVLDGTTYFLAVRGIAGGPVEAIPYRRDAEVGSFEQFRTHTQNQYAENESGGSEGLR